MHFVTVHREALKVFLGFLTPFSSEKGVKPPEALAAKPRYSARSAANASASAKGGLGEKQEFFPQRNRVWGKPRGVFPKRFFGFDARKIARAFHKAFPTVKLGIHRNLSHKSDFE